MRREPGRAGCAAESLERSEPLLGTASRVRRWLLVEQPGSWGRDAVRESRVPDDVAQRLHRRARDHGVRVVLIRRSMQPTGSTSHSAYLVRSDRAAAWVERVDVPEPAALATLDLTVLDGDEPPGIGEAAGPLHLVCTNGRHDPCCADLGRPVVRALRDGGIDVWECSHIGGDRFAANLVCLPSGVYFGRVPADGAAAIVHDHAAGLLALEHYRGRSCHPPLVQAAEVLARLELDERRRTELEPRAWTVSGDRATVDLGRVTAEVTRRPGAPVALVCGGDESSAWEYRLEALRPT
jgi:hypothetical protein